jgi:hypothetical protein
MNVQKAAYWLALGAFALALHSGYRQGDSSLFHRIQARTSSEFCRIAAHAEQTLAMARLLTTGAPSPVFDNDSTTPRQAEMEQPHALIQGGAHRAMALQLVKENRAALRQVGINGGTALRQAEVNLETNLRQSEVNRAMALRQADLDQMQQKMQRVRIVMQNTQFENLRGVERVNVNLSDASARHMVVACHNANAQVVVGTDSDSADHDSADHEFADPEVE